MNDTAFLCYHIVQHNLKKSENHENQQYWLHETGKLHLWQTKGKELKSNLIIVILEKHSCKWFSYFLASLIFLVLP